MVECKLCRGDTELKDTSKSDPRMCKRCYADVAKYRRWQTSSKPLKPEQEKIVVRLEGMFEKNLKDGYYVPKSYVYKKRPVDCATCGVTMYTSSGLTVCNGCYTKESVYIKLVGTGSPMVHKYDAYYADLYNDGRKVPQLWLRRHNKTAH